MQTITIKDNRINRNHCAGEFMEMCKEIVKDQTGMEREFAGHFMSWDEFKSSSYRKDYRDVQVDCTMDFNSNSITITIK